MAAEHGFSDGAVQRLISALPAEQCEVLVLVCAKNLTYQQTADCLGIPVESVVSRLLNARQSLIAVMDGTSLPAAIASAEIEGEGRFRHADGP